jgi:hypothetical protein
MNLPPPPSGAFLHPEGGNSGCPRNFDAYIPVDTVSFKGTLILVTDVRASDLKNRVSHVEVFLVYTMCIKNLHKTELRVTETYVWESVCGCAATGYVIFSFHGPQKSPQCHICRPAALQILHLCETMYTITTQCGFIIFNIGEDGNHMN